MSRWITVIIVAMFAVPAWAGDASLLNGAQFAELLKNSQPCCVIDARSEGLRKQAPIPFAVVHHEGLSIKQTSFAIVVADYDVKALEIAHQLVTPEGKNIYALIGGYTTWHQVKFGLTPLSGAPKKFNIPSDTCEQGKPLQEYK
ncbi:MAG: hypothetical protein P8Y67_08040 [Alphaproteobacteria bacterium]